jgi:hypothetical protein
LITINVIIDRWLRLVQRPPLPSSTRLFCVLLPGGE